MQAVAGTVKNASRYKNERTEDATKKTLELIEKEVGKR